MKAMQFFLSKKYLYILKCHETTTTTTTTKTNDIPSIKLKKKLIESKTLIAFSLLFSNSLIVSVR